MKLPIKIIVIIASFLLLFILPASALTTSDCNKENEEWLVQECYSRIGINNQDVKLCDKSGDYAGNCYYKIALKTEDSLLCKKAQKFEFQCYMELAVQIENFSLCELTKVPQNCFSKIYQETQDSRLCEYLEEKPIECLCTENETLIDGRCTPLVCKKGEVIENRACIKKCQPGYYAQDGQCKSQCEFGYSPSPDGAGCGRESIVWVLYSFAMELPLLFILFALIMLFFKIKVIEKVTSLFKDGILLSGLKYLFAYLCTLICVFLFISRPYSLIDVFESSPSPIPLLLVFFIPFIIGVITQSAMRFIEQRKYKYRLFIENVLLGLGIVIFMQYMNGFLGGIFEEIGFYYVLMPIYVIMEKMMIHFYIYFFYIYFILEFVYLWIIFSLIISLSRHLYTFGFYKMVAWVSQRLPSFIKTTFKWAFIFMPFLVLVFPWVAQHQAGGIGVLTASLGDFPDVYFYLGVEQFFESRGIDMQSFDTRLYYSLWIYSFIWAIMLVLAKYTISYASRKFTK
ncbi:MAG TPA: hypothetical protein VJH37_04865 [Candidatus Nanoarchaeia archaeon]|nr:hypothetical protein [Candidatus Nanoarchaeia archaeon]